MLFLITLSWTDSISSTVTVSERKPSWEFFTRSTDAWVKCKELENSGDVVISNDYTLGWVSKCFSVAFLVLDVTYVIYEFIDTTLPYLFGFCNTFWIVSFWFRSANYSTGRRSPHCVMIVLRDGSHSKITGVYMGIFTIGLRKQKVLLTYS